MKNKPKLINSSVILAQIKTSCKGEFLYKPENNRTSFIGTKDSAYMSLAHFEKHSIYKLVFRIEIMYNGNNPLANITKRHPRSSKPSPRQHYTSQSTQIEYSLFITKEETMVSDHLFSNKIEPGRLGEVVRLMLGKSSAQLKVWTVHPFTAVLKH